MKVLTFEFTMTAEIQVQKPTSTGYAKQQLQVINKGTIRKALKD